MRIRAKPIIVSGIAAVAAAYSYYTPYQTLNQIESLARANNNEAMADYWVPAVLRESVSGQILRRVNARGGTANVGMFGSLVEVAKRQMIEVTTDKIVSLAFLSKLHEPIEVEGGAEGKEGKAFYKRGYNGLTRFVWYVENATGRAQLVLTRSGLGWELSDILLDTHGVTTKSAAPATVSADDHKKASLRAGKGPFGLEMGMSLEQLKALDGFREIDRATYFVPSVPVPDKRFEGYVLTVTETQGLCRVDGVGESLEMNGFGTQVKERFSALHDALESKYGKSAKSFDFLRAGSIWRDANDWAMALSKKERHLVEYWTISPDSELGRTTRLASVLLQAAATTSSSGYVSIRYEFQNNRECDAEEKASRDSAL